MKILDCFFRWQAQILDIGMARHWAQIMMMGKSADLPVIQKTLDKTEVRAVTEGHCWKDRLFTEHSINTQPREADGKGKVR